MTSEDAFLKFREALLTAIFENPSWKKAKASGRAESFLRSQDSYTIDGNRFVQYGTSYTPYIDAGRPKNRRNTGGLREAIYDWLQYRKYGLEWTSEQERVSMSYAIATNIAKRGSWKFRKNKQTSIFADAIASAVPTLEEAVGEWMLFRTSSAVGDEVERINKLPR